MLSKLLISPILVLSTLAFAGIEDDFTTSANGFVYATIFSDNNWHDDKYKGAVNINVAYKDNLKLSLQASTDEIISRAAIEYSHPVSTHTALFISYGRIQRTDSFFNNTTDNPGSSGLAILPFSAYNYKLQSSTFTTIQGIETKAIVMTKDDHLLTIRGTLGNMVISDKKLLSDFLTNDTTKNISAKSSYDMAIHYETSNYHTFFSSTGYAFDIDGVCSGYQINKVGIKYTTSAGWIQSEIARNRFHSTETHSTREYYVILGTNVTDKYQAYLGYSSSKASTDDKANDSFIGISKENGNYSFSVEYHKGRGSDWMKSREAKPDSWSAVVTSVTYRFK